jgi:hypothetical protein
MPNAVRVSAFGGDRRGHWVRDRDRTDKRHVSCVGLTKKAHPRAQTLNIAFHMRIRKLESIIRQMDATSAILPENV